LLDAFCNGATQVSVAALQEQREYAARAPDIVGAKLRDACLGSNLERAGRSYTRHFTVQMYKPGSHSSWIVVMEATEEGAQIRGFMGYNQWKNHNSIWQMNYDELANQLGNPSISSRIRRGVVPWSELARLTSLKLCDPDGAKRITFHRPAERWGWEPVLRGCRQEPYSIVIKCLRSVLPSICKCSPSCPDGPCRLHVADGVYTESASAHPVRAFADFL